MKTQAISLDNAINKDIAEVKSLKKRIADADTFIKTKVMQIKEKKAAAATAKALAEKNKALKLAEKKAAEKKKALQIAQNAVDDAKKDVARGEVVSCQSLYHDLVLLSYSNHSGCQHK